MSLKGMIIELGISLLFGVLFLLTGCRSENKENGNMADGSRSDISAGLPLPIVPDSLVAPEERTAFAVSQFWMGLDTTPAELRKDTVFMEQSFSNFISLLPYTGKEAIENAFSILLGELSTDIEEARLMDEVAYKYLSDPNSPMRSEDVYIVYLEKVLSAASYPEDVKERSKFRLQEAMKNRPGSRAADFKVMDEAGRHTSLYDVIANDTTVIMFFDPECDQCKKTIARLKDTSIKLPYRVVMTDVTERNKVDGMPDTSALGDLEVVYAVEDLEESGKYAFPALPSFYLLAPDGTVLLKDFSI